MNSNPKLSIIVPMYNCENYIETCVDSLLNQELSLNEYEIIIIDDGSTDNSRAIVEKKYNNYENIRIISFKNGGQSYARNKGIENAKGKYIFFVDADDYISKNSIKNILDLSLKNNLDMMFFDISRVESDTEFICRYNEIKKIDVVDGIMYFANNNVNNGPWQYLISKEFIKNNNLRFVEGRYCEDGMFLISCIFKAKRVSYSKVDIYRYVIRANSTITKRNNEHLEKIIEDFVYAIEYINQYYKEAKKKDYPKNFIEQLETRRNSYIFFMQVRMIKSRVGYKNAKKIIKRLRDINCYKYKRLTKKYYPDIIFGIGHKIFNCENLFCSLCCIKLFEMG